jgi:acetyl-CoA C-acetyltransferase
MGDCAELCAEHYQISREAMDDHAIEAFERARAAAPYTRYAVLLFTT